MGDMESNKFVNDLTEGSVGKKLALFSLPFLLSNFLQLLYGTVDALVISWYGSAEGIIGVTQGTSLTFLVTNTLIGFAVGGTILIAQYVGAKRPDDRRETVSTLFTFFIIASVALSVIMLAVGRPLLALMDVPEEAVDETLGYYNICMAGTVFVAMYNGIAAVMRGMGDSKRPMWFVAIACAVNIGLDYMLVAWLGMGARGAALATIISQFISVVLSVWYLRRNDFEFDFKPKSFRITGSKLRQLMKTGFPSAFHKLFVSLSFVVVNAVVNQYGLLAASASGLVGKINGFAVLPFLALQTAVTAMGGQNIGAGRYDRASKAMWWSIGMSFVIAVVIFLLSQFAPRLLLGIFTDREDILEYAIPFLKMYSYEYLIMAFGFSMNGLMMGSGHTLLSMISGIMASVILRVPLAIIFSETLGYGFPGVALGSAMATFGSPLMGTIFYLSGAWKRKKTI